MEEIKFDIIYGFKTIPQEFTCKIIGEKPESFNFMNHIEFVTENAFELMDIIEFIGEFVFDMFR